MYLKVFMRETLLEERLDLLLRRMQEDVGRRDNAAQNAFLKRAVQERISLEDELSGSCRRPNPFPARRDTHISWAFLRAEPCQLHLAEGRQPLEVELWSALQHRKVRPVACLSACNCPAD